MGSQGVKASSAESEDQDQPVRMRRLIYVSTVHMQSFKFFYFSDLSLHWVHAFLGSLLRKHAYSNILQILSSKNENFQMKKSDNFHVSAQNIDCWYSLEPPRVPTIYVLIRNKKNNAYPCKPQFYYIKVGFKGVKII